MAIKVEEALEIIYKNVSPKSVKILPIEQALGFVLAQNVVAKHNLPPYDNSAMDGYAVQLCDAGKAVKVTHTIFAGDDSDEILIATNAIKIMTGARIPEGCECIVPFEEVNVISSNESTQGSEVRILLPENLQNLKHIRFAGEDIRVQDSLLTCGEKLHAHQITLLASQGISHVKVYKKPKIALFASGSELKMHFENVESHQLYNTNTPTFFSRALELGCEVDFIGTAVDTMEDIKAHIQSALSSDLIITSGGVSVGDADFTKEAFADFGCEIFFDKIAIKPGKPTTVGKIGNTMVLNLPGNPLAAALNFELFGQSIILALSGAYSKYLNPIKAKMKDTYKLKKGKRTIVPGFFDGEFFIHCAVFAPGMVSPLGHANAYIMIDESCEQLDSNAPVNVIPMRFTFTKEVVSDLRSGV